MDASASHSLLRFLDEIEDPRMDRTRRHELSDILAISILAVLCGAEYWTQFVDFGRAKQSWLETFLRLPNGIPSHDTFARVFALLDPDAFEQWFTRWINALAEATEGRLIALDGKTLRGSFDRADGRAAIHMVSAWSHANHLVLGQVATEAKSNEITAMPKLLSLLDVEGAVVTLDAMGCQKSIAKQIKDQNGDYVMQVKANQGKLYDQLKVTLDEAIALNFEDMPSDFAETVEGDHGRVEKRRLWCTSEVDWVPGAEQWPGLRSVACMESERQVEGGTEVDRHYYISSTAGTDASRFLEATRGHWGIENGAHWALDVSFEEDASRVRKGHAAENFSRLRRIALNLLKQETSRKGGIKSRRLICGWDHDYLLKVLQGGLPD